MEDPACIERQQQKDLPADQNHIRQEQNTKDVVAIWHPAQDSIHVAGHSHVGHEHQHAGQAG